MVGKEVKNTKEVLALLFVVSKIIAKEAKKDGFQYTDLISFLGSQEFKAAFSLAVDDIGEVYSEIKDIDLDEGFELALFAAKEGFTLVKELIQKPHNE